MTRELSEAMGLPVGSAVACLSDAKGRTYGLMLREEVSNLVKECGDNVRKQHDTIPQLSLTKAAYLKANASPQATLENKRRGSPIPLSERPPSTHLLMPVYRQESR